MTGWTSLYIPYLDTTYTQDELTYLFEVKYAIGKIKRIDIVYGRLYSGTGKKTAFIHFDTWYLNDFTIFLRNQLETRGKYNMTSYSDYLLEKVEHYSDCEICKTMYQTKLSELRQGTMDDIPLLIHRTKHAHIHSFTKSAENQGFTEFSPQAALRCLSPVAVPPLERATEFPRSPSASASASRAECFAEDARGFTDSVGQSLRSQSAVFRKDDVGVLYENRVKISEIVEQHEKRIELLEEEIGVLVQYFIQTENKK